MVPGLRRAPRLCSFLLLTTYCLWKIHGVRATSNPRTVLFALDNNTACGKSMVSGLSGLYFLLLIKYRLWKILYRTPGPYFLCS